MTILLRNTTSGDGHSCMGCNAISDVAVHRLQGGTLVPDGNIKVLEVGHRQYVAQIRLCASCREKVLGALNLERSFTQLKYVSSDGTEVVLKPRAPELERLKKLITSEAKTLVLDEVSLVKKSVKRGRPCAECKRSDGTHQPRCTTGRFPSIQSPKKPKRRKS